MSTAPPSRTLSARTAIASAWVVGAQFIAKFADFLTLLILARLLSPADFGLVAMAMTAVLVTEAVTELPLMQALVRSNGITDSMLDTAFTLSLLRGVVIGVALIGLAAPLAAFYDEPRIQMLSCVLALAPVLRGLASPRLAVYMRDMDFRPEFRLMVVARLVTLVCASAVALTTGSYWAIAVGTLMAPAARMALSFVLAPYRPRLGLRDWPLFADMVGWHSVSQLFSALSWQMGRILLGRLSQASSLGFYTMASTIVALPQQALLQPLGRPLMSAFSDAARRGALHNAVAQSTYVLVAAGTPCLLVLSVLARPIVEAVLGPDWTASAPLLRWEALAVLLGVPLAVLGPLAMTLDRTRYSALRMGLEFALTLPLMYALISSLGVIGAVYARVVVAIAMLGFNFWIVRRLLDVPMRAQLRGLVRPAVSLVPMFAILTAGERLLPAELGGPALAAATGIVACAGLLVYACALGLLWRTVGSPAGPEARLVGWLGVLRTRLAA